MQRECVRSPDSFPRRFVVVVVENPPAQQRKRTPRPAPNHRLSVALRDTLQLILLLDGVRVAAALGGVDQLLSQALGDRLDVAEGGLTGAGGEQGDGLVDAAEGRDIDGLSADGTGGTNTGAVFPGTAVDDSIDGDLDRVLVGHDVDLAWPC